MAAVAPADPSSSATTPAVSAPAQDAERWTVYWKNYTHLVSPDGRLRLNFGGRIETDFAAVGPNDRLLEDVPNAKGTGVELRRTRVFAAGTLYDHFGDFEGSR